ncbi:MAG: class I SAM-dependent methyltransferase [Caldilineaceae bacterium]
MDRKTYMKDVYAKYWLTARDKIYGFLKYDQSMCDLIHSRVAEGADLLEVAVGTGYPLADFFQKAGYTVHGVDLAFELVQKCRSLHPGIHSIVGDAENLSYPDGYFSCVYCLHSTWYIPNLNQAVDEMLRVARPGGIVIFDIQNRNNPAIGAEYQKSLSINSGRGISLRVFRGFGNHIRKGEIINAFLLIKGFVISVLRRKTGIWHTVIHAVPTYPEDVYAHLKERQVQFDVWVRREDETIEQRCKLDSACDFERLIFVVTK